MEERERAEAGEPDTSERLPINFLERKKQRGGPVGEGGGGGEDVRAYDAFAEGEAPPEPYPTEPPVEIDRPEAEAELMHKNVLLP